ncbi:MAG: ACT domain-containing protein, partial [Erysipelotrichaceae bacterium]|nr:ACT domain-containing protein [Erysipelotrichaceae bacterium]
PGMIARVTECLSSHQINIAQMNVTRENAGDQAIMIIEVDSHDATQALAEIRNIPQLYNVNFFD